MEKEYTATVTLTMAFGYEGEQTDDQVKEMALDAIGSMSDNWIAEGMTIETEEVT